MTLTRSHIPATTPRSWVIRISAASLVGDQLTQQVEDLRLDRDVERRRRLVGDQQLRLARERHRDHRALAHPARELVRVVLEPRARARDADAVEQLDRALVAPRFLLMPKWVSSASADLARRSSAPGSGYVIGSWKIIAISLPRMLAQLRSAASSRLRPLEHRRPVGDPPGARQDARGSRARSRSCRSRTRRRCRASRPARCRTRPR